MNINKENQNGTLTVTITGRVDTTTAPVLEQGLKESFDECTSLVLDFAGVRGHLFRRSEGIAFRTESDGQKGWNEVNPCQ